VGPPGSPRRLVLAQYHHQDWVWSVAARRGTLFTTAGSAQYSWDAETGRAAAAEGGGARGEGRLAVEASVAGHYVFTAGRTGLFRCSMRGSGREKRRRGRRGWGEAGGGGGQARGAGDVVAGPRRAGELAASRTPGWCRPRGTGCCGVMDVGRTMRADRRTPGWRSRAPWRGAGAGGAGPCWSPVVLGGAHASILSVDMGHHERVVCGKIYNIRVLDFQRAQGAGPEKEARQGGRGRKGEGGGCWEPRLAARESLGSQCSSSSSASCSLLLYRKDPYRRGCSGAGW